VTQPVTCPFCRIIEGGDAAREVLRTSEVVAFFPTEPAVLGHVLIVPTRHVESVYDLDRTTAIALTAATVDVARAVKETFNPDGLNIVQSNGEAATQTVPHLHVHVLPRNEGDSIGDLWPAHGVTNAASLDLARTNLAAALGPTSSLRAVDAEDRRHHLQLISNVIERLSQASARAKGWTVTAAGAAFGVAAFDGRWYLSLLGIAVIAVFLDQDARYLREERLFVELYKAADCGHVEPFNMNKNAHRNNVSTYWQVLASWSVLPFYVIFLFLGLVATLGGLLHESNQPSEPPVIVHRHHHAGDVAPSPPSREGNK
jgi:ATP adenylyltransferase